MRSPSYTAMLLAIGMLIATMQASAQHAITAYKCVTASGHVSFQDTPCPRHQRQHALHLAAPPPPGSSPAPVAAAPSAPAPDHPPPAPSRPPPRHAIPVLYACRRATDGTRYISRHGQPRPYYVPLGILGWPSRSLSDQLATPDPPAAATPRHDRATRQAARLAGTYTRVQDRCRQLSIPETCRELRDEHDAIEEKIRQAFRSDRPPLEKREQALQSELSGC